MIRSLLVLCLGVCLAGPALAQAPEAQAKKADEIVAKMRRMDMLIQFLPLNFKKEQLNPILKVLEQYRAEEQRGFKFEYEQLRLLEKEIDSTLKDGYEAGKYPPRAVQNKIFNVTGALSAGRRNLVEEWTNKVFAVVAKECDGGQKKTMSKALDIRFFDANAKPDTMTEDDKIKFFIKIMMLDRQGYPVLLEISKKAPSRDEPPKKEGDKKKEGDGK